MHVIVLKDELTAFSATDEKIPKHFPIYPGLFRLSRSVETM